MRALGFYFVLPFIYGISLLPFPLLYLFSDIMYLLVYKILGYRKTVVTENLTNAFPDKTKAEIVQIRKAFYHYLCDLFLETFKTLTISKSKMLSRFAMSENASKLFERYYREKKSVILVLGHHGNWEWAGNAFSIMCAQKLFVIYHQLQNPFFNKLIIHMRTRFGTGLIEMKQTFREMVRLKTEVTATAFIADQWPSPESAQWVNFLSQETAVFKGPEVIARKMNYPVVFVRVCKKGRGHYEFDANTLCENANDLTEGRLTELHTKALEQEIRQQPETWLWSHKRWKHSRPASI